MWKPEHGAGGAGRSGGTELFLVQGRNFLCWLLLPHSPLGLPCVALVLTANPEQRQRNAPPGEKWSRRAFPSSPPPSPCPSLRRACSGSHASPPSLRGFSSLTPSLLYQVRQSPLLLLLLLACLLCSDLPNLQSSQAAAAASNLLRALLIPFYHIVLVLVPPCFLHPVRKGIGFRGVSSRKDGDDGLQVSCSGDDEGLLAS